MTKRVDKKHFYYFLLSSSPQASKQASLLNSLNAIEFPEVIKIAKPFIMSSFIIACLCYRKITLYLTTLMLFAFFS